MKSFLKVIVTIIVIAVIIGSVYYLEKINSCYKIKQICDGKNDKKEETVNQIENNEVKEQEPANEVTPSSDFFNSSIEEQIAYINLIEQRNIEANATKTIEENVGLETIGIEYSDLFKTMQMDSALVVIQVAGSMISILPYSDFIDAQEFHYDENGHLVLYTYTETGRGLKSKYYINNNEVISIEREEEPLENETIDEVINSGEDFSGEVNKISEPIVEREKINFSDMFARSKALYEKYIKAR